MSKRVYQSEAEAQTAKERAEQFVRDVLDDDERADEIADQSLGDWLEDTNRRISNPVYIQEKETLVMATRRTATRTQNKDQMIEELESLREENGSLRDALDSTQEALDEANSRLTQIYDLSSDEFEPDITYETGGEEDEEDGD